VQHAFTATFSASGKQQSEQQQQQQSEQQQQQQRHWRKQLSVCSDKQSTLR
jgi:hypothetical protein